VTLGLCNLCLLTLLARVFWAPFLSRLLLVLAVVTFLSGPVVPIAGAVAQAPRRGNAGVHQFILLGWLTNFLIGAVYLAIAVLVLSFTSV
jgi:hypothetical protein